MASYRNLQMSFWTDSKVQDELGTDERYFFIYLLTNPHTSNSGCYESGLRQMAFESGFGVKEVEKLLRRLEDVDMIRYDNGTKEVLILRWFKYNWTASADFQKSLRYAISQVKSPAFREYLTACADGQDTVPTPSIDRPQTVGTPSHEGGGTTVTVTVTDNTTVTDTFKDTVTVKDTVTEDTKEIIEHLNTVCGTKYKASSEQTKSLIRARKNDGFTRDDFFTVIDTMSEKWMNDPKMRDYLRPQTLFGTKFESYLNTPRGQPVSQFDQGQAYLMQIVESGS